MQLFIKISTISREVLSGSLEVTPTIISSTSNYWGVRIKGKNTVLFDDFMFNKTTDKKLCLKNTK